MSQVYLHYVRPQVLMKPECDGKIIEPQRQYQTVVVGFCFGWFCLFLNSRLSSSGYLLILKAKIRVLILIEHGLEPYYMPGTRYSGNRDKTKVSL